MGKRIYLATPCYSPPCTDYVVSMQMTQKALTDAGIQFDMGFVTGLCYIHTARNMLVKSFKASECDEMVFIDSDIGWRPDDFLRLVKAEANVVGGAVPYRTAQAGFPVLLKRGDDGHLQGVVKGEDVLIEAGSVPTAMLKITRGVFQKLANDGQAPWREEVNGATGEVVKRWRSYFDFEVEGEHEYGEDVTFCRKCTRSGIKLWVDPKMTLRHWGTQCFEGQLHAWLQNPEQSGGKF